MKKQVYHYLQTFWLLTQSDLWTFVIPNTAFGIFGGLAGPILTTNFHREPWTVLTRAPLVVAWNWLNLSIFNLANQRLPDSVAEDFINKPWRPIPAGRMSTIQMRRVLLATIPTVSLINYVWLGAWKETIALICLTWMYNDLRGGDENFVLRNFIIGTAFGLYNSGSLQVACSSHHTLHARGRMWVGVISTVVFSTMHIQDLQDVTGDKLRGRRSAPLILGDSVARWTLAISIPIWSFLCPLYLGMPWFGFLAPGFVGGIIILRLFLRRGPREDCMSWYTWAFWMILLYMLPAI